MHSNIRSFKSLFFIIFLLVTASQINATEKEKSKRVLLDFDWKFKLGNIQNAEITDFNDADWRVLDLPHDWSIEGEISKDNPSGGSGGYFPGGIGWYRKHLEMTGDDLSKIVWIEFDGVYMNSEVWINGKYLGLRPYGYSSFYYDLSPYLQEGENVIAVKVDNSKQPNSRWYSGSGIYRNVWLTKQDPLHIAHWGTYVITPDVNKENAVVKVETKIDNEYETAKDGKLLSIIVDADGNNVASSETPFKCESGKTVVLNQDIEVKSPKLWSIESPNLYKLEQTIITDDKEVNCSVTTIGIRQIEYSAKNGFSLNGQQVKMKGVCIHHDGGCVGAAVPIDIWRYRFRKLKEMGCNAIRSSHNPPAPEFLDLCDEMGFIVMDEAFDEWQEGKREFAYHLYFDEWYERDLTAMLVRDRNHPSIVIWSVGNEVPDQKTERGTEILKKLQDICHNVDPTRPVTQACDNIVADSGPTKLSFLNELDIVGYNYVDRWHERRELYYSLDKIEHPEWKMIGTENVANKGVLRGDYSLGDDPNKVEPNYTSNMIRAEQLWKFESLHDYVIGDFMWTGYDYLGETRWPMKSWNFGVIDHCGFPKDGFYFYQSQWTKEAMLHLFPHWNWEGREGQIIPVLCYTNCEEVELFLNGKSYGTKRYEFPRQGTSKGWNSYDHPKIQSTTSDLHLQWDVPYEPGILKAVGKIDGKVVYTEEIRTAGKPNKIRLSTKEKVISAANRGVSNIKVEILDKDGNVVPTADNLVEFSAEGAGQIIGIDNANPIDKRSFKEMKRSAYNGLCLAVIQAAKKSGEVKVVAKSEGLESDEISIDVE